MSEQNPHLRALSDMLIEAMNREANLRAQLIAALQRAATAEAPPVKEDPHE